MQKHLFSSFLKASFLYSISFHVPKTIAQYCMLVLVMSIHYQFYICGPDPL